MPRIIFADFSNNSGTRTPDYPIPYVAMDVVYLRHDARPSYFVKPGDYWVARADNRRILGSLERPRDVLDRVTANEWHAWPLADAFRGDHFDDEGDFLDEVPEDLRRDRSGRVGMGGFTHRDRSTESLLQHLYEWQAPAMGFGPRWDVQRYESPMRKGGKVTRRTMVAGPYPTVRVLDEYGIADRYVPDGARPLRFDNLVKES